MKIKAPFIFSRHCSGQFLIMYCWYFSTYIPLQGIEVRSMVRQIFKKGKSLMEMPLDLRTRQSSQLTEVIVSSYPKCDICCQPAHYDAATSGGAWGYFCEVHFNMYCLGLGTGIGQRLIVRERKA